MADIVCGHCVSWKISADFFVLFKKKCSSCFQVVKKERAVLNIVRIFLNARKSGAVSRDMNVAIVGLRKGEIL